MAMQMNFFTLSGGSSISGTWCATIRSLWIWHWGVLLHYDPRMAVHTLRIPDRMHGRALRSIVWDDEAGTVTGEHSNVDSFLRVFAANKPVTVGDTGLAWDLTDPAHDPAQFLAVLWSVYAPALDEPLRSTLPAVFDGVDLPPNGSGEILYDEDGSQLV